eukprot:6620175-Prymnesium_polylepis.1
MEACVNDASGREGSTEHGGLLLWLAEGDIQWLANKRGEAIRCWRARLRWQGAVEVIEGYELVLTCIPQEKHGSDDPP